MFDGQHEDRRLSSSSADPFQSTLPLIIDYVGIGHWMFLSEISHSWLKAYKKLRYQEIATLSESGLPGGFKILTKCCTCYSAAFASESRLRLAQSRGLHLEADSYKLQRMAGRSASIDVLKVAHDLGLVFTAHVMRGAAES
eukprot:8976-Heterococcus_DN1.PRE.1